MPKDNTKEPKNPIAEIGKKKLEDYDEINKLLNELHEYLKPIVGEDNEEVNKRIHKIKFKLTMMPLTDMLQTTLQASMGMFMAGKKFDEYNKEFNQDFMTKNKDFEKFIKGTK